MKVMHFKEKVSKFIVVTMASALVVSSMFTDYGFATHANETTGEPGLESVTGGDVVAEPVPLYDYAQPTDNFAKPDLSNPFLFSVYTNQMTKSDHVEGNVAIGVLPGYLSIYGGNDILGEGGVSYIGDLSNGQFVCSTKESYIVIPEINPTDGTANKMVIAPGQGYRLCKISADNVELSSFITDGKLRGFSYQDNIGTTIANTLSAKAAWSGELYALPDMDTDTAYVLNVTSEELNAGFGNGQKYEDKIIVAAEAGKTVIVNITSSGEVSIPDMNANVATERGNRFEYASWAGRVLWNCGNASRVSTGRTWGFILAPSATVVNGGNTIGGIISSSFEQYGEVHQVHWVGVIPPPPVPTATPEPTATPVPTPEPTETPAPTPGPTETPEPEPTETPAPTPSPTETPGPEPTETPAPTPGPTETPGPEPTETPAPTPGPTETPGPEPTETPAPTPGPTETPGPEPTETPAPTPGPTETPGPEPTETPAPTPGPTETPGPEPTETPAPTPSPTETPGPESTPEPTPGPLEPTPTPEVPSEPTPTPPPAVTEPPQVTQPPQVTEPPVTPDIPTTPELETRDVPVTPQPPVNGVRRRRTVRIDDEETPLSDAMVLGARRRPQTGDESDAWMMMFLASLSALAAWILKGVKK